jgi:DNA-binding transcriptional MerR regulator
MSTKPIPAPPADLPADRVHYQGHVIARAQARLGQEIEEIHETTRLRLAQLEADAENVKATAQARIRELEQEAERIKHAAGYEISQLQQMSNDLQVRVAELGDHNPSPNGARQ